MKKLIFYTDLDGTLLNHHDYCWRDAESTLQQLNNLNFPVIFNTSKTLKEVHKLQHETGVTGPFVIENGGAVWIPDNYFKGELGRLVILGKDIQTILSVLEPLRSKYSFESFSDMHIERVAELTGLNLDDAAMSSQRLCSEPLIWNDSEEQLENFKEELLKLDLDLLKGGRFYHVTGFSGKGDALKYLQKLYENEYPEMEISSVALGDSPNDLSMLAEADIAVVIPRASGKNLCPDNENIITASEKGALGWKTSVNKILSDLYKGVRE